MSCNTATVPQLLALPLCQQCRGTHAQKMADACNYTEIPIMRLYNRLLTLTGHSALYALTQLKRPCMIKACTLTTLSKQHGVNCSDFEKHCLLAYCSSASRFTELLTQPSAWATKHLAGPVVGVLCGCKSEQQQLTHLPQQGSMPGVHMHHHATGLRAKACSVFRSL